MLLTLSIAGKGFPCFLRKVLLSFVFHFSDETELSGPGPNILTDQATFEICSLHQLLSKDLQLSRLRLPARVPATRFPLELIAFPRNIRPAVFSHVAQCSAYSGTPFWSRSPVGRPPGDFFSLCCQAGELIALILRLRTPPSFGDPLLRHQPCSFMVCLGG